MYPEYNDITVAHILSRHILNEDYVTAWNMVNSARHLPDVPVATDGKDSRHGSVEVRYTDDTWIISAGKNVEGEAAGVAASGLNPDGR